jgi:hypothetical protein
MPRPITPARVPIAALAALLFALSACGGGPMVATVSLPATTHLTTTPPAIPGAGSCRNLSPAHDDKHGIEVRGTTTDHEPLVVLFAGTHRTIPSGKALTTYVRVGGVRALQISIGDRAGSVRRLLGFRPGLPPFDWPGAGTPWTGTTTFPQAGCWRIDVQRGGLTGQLWLRAS